MYSASGAIRNLGFWFPCRAFGALLDDSVKWGHLRPRFLGCLFVLSYAELLDAVTFEDAEALLHEVFRQDRWAMSVVYPRKEAK